MRVNVRKIAHPVTLRWKTSDRMVFDQIFGRAESVLPDIPKSYSPKTIIDLGANIGFTSVAYANLFPESLIIAVEPESDNFEMLTLNTRYYPTIKLLKKCVWPVKTQLKLADANAESWSFQFSPDGVGPSVETTTIPEIIEDFCLDGIDILKIDIEGGEKDLFGSNTAGWVKRVEFILVEPHERYAAGCTSKIKSALAATHKQLSSSGEYLVFQRRDKIA